MDFEWGSEYSLKFISNVGLITSNGPFGHNIMSAEWTHMLSYKPFMVSVSIRPGKASHANMLESKEFGVSLASAGQDVAASVAGGFTGKEVDKIALLQELGVEFYDGKKIKVKMVKDASLNAEFKLVKKIEAGSHTLFIGEAVELSALPKPPLAYHQGQYWLLGKNVKKPSEETREKIKLLGEKHKRV